MTAAWVEAARRLADGVAAAGDLHDPVWRAAVGAVPRHRFVPRYLEQDADGSWRTVGEDDPGYWSAVYSDQTLLTALAEVGGAAGRQRVPVSSSTAPGLMVRMLEALDVHDGHRVLEIGTGTGYNAALLAARLGDTQVFSVELRPDLTEAARQRLADTGYHPTLVTRDGAEGLAEHAPYDRIIATCAVPAVPPAWLAQTAPDGLILTDIQGSLYAGNVAGLRRAGDGAEGRFLPTWAGFMPMRHSLDLPDVAASRLGPGPARERRTALRPAVLDEPVIAFLAQLHLPAGTTRRTTIHGDGTNGTTSTVLQLSPGCWAQVSDEPDRSAEHRVLESGDPPLWGVVEDAHRQWQQLGEPGWSRLGVTATPCGQRVWLDAPTGTSWPLD